MSLKRWHAVGLATAVLGLGVLWCFRTPILAFVLFRGESVSYAIWNNRTDVELHSLLLTSSEGELAGGEYEVHPPLPPGGGGWAHGGSAVLRDANHRIPEVAYVSWRIPAKHGQDKFEGTKVGPIPVKLRSRIPTDVLQQIRGSRRYYLEIGVSAGIAPVLVRWRLVDGEPAGQLAPIEVQRGGDW